MSLLISTKRRIIQTFSLVALNANLLGFASERFCLPVMNCEACAFAFLGCPIGMMGRAIVFHEIPWLVLGIVFGIGLLVGRFFCGWVCPIGFLEDLLYKIPSPKFTMPRPLAWLKYVFLLGAVAAAAFWLGLDSGLYYCNFCPTSGLGVLLPTMVRYGDWTLDPGRVIKLGVVLLILVLGVLSHRSFCKVMCPVGAMIAISNKFAFLAVRIKPSKCVRCRKCDKVCSMDVKAMSSQDRGRAVNRDTECITCLACEQACPVKAISNNSRVL